jgi:hypothetical protein
VPSTLLSTTAGLHVPFIPFEEVVGNTGTFAPIQTDWKVPKLKVGVTTGFTVTLKVKGVTHCPAAALKTYIPLCVLLTTDGLHMPTIPLSEVVGNVGAVAPWQIVKLLPKLNTGITLVVTVTLNVITAGVTHCPAFGVNV